MKFQHILFEVQRLVNMAYLFVRVLHFCSLVVILLSKAVSKQEKRFCMLKGKIERLDAWVTASEAAKILTANSGHQITTDYVRRLGHTKKITVRPIVPGKTNLYLKSDVEAYVVRTKKNTWVSEALAS